MGSTADIPRVAVVGAGTIGRRHIQVAAESDSLELVAVADPSMASADIADQYAVQHFDSLAGLLDARTCDGIVLATPNRLHSTQATACIEARVPVLVEKPLADSVEGALEIARVSREYDVPVLVGHHRQHSAIMARAVDIINSGSLGEIVALMGSALFYKAESEGYFAGENAWRRKPGGGPILLNLIHEIGNLRMLCGEIERVQAFTSNATRGFPVEDSVSISLGFTGGALGTFILSDCAASPFSWEHTSGEDPRFGEAHNGNENCYQVTGTLGSLSIPTMRVHRYLDPSHRSWHREMSIQIEAPSPLDPIVAQMAHFARVIVGQERPLVGVLDGLRNLQVVEAIKRAATSGQAETIDALF